MRCYPLLAKNGGGSAVNMPLPEITAATFWEKNTEMLAVIFDIKNCPNKDFLPNFANGVTAKNPSEIAELRQDYLWESHCYELFLAFGDRDNSPYFEINFSPSGNFNIYHFDSYRQPEQMPPRRLDFSKDKISQLFNVFYKKQNQQPVCWQKFSSKQHELLEVLPQKIFSVENNFQLGMLIDMGLLKSMLQNVGNIEEMYLNPCAVYAVKSEKLAYFAHHHAMPPDFHDKKCWMKITPEFFHC